MVIASKPLRGIVAFALSALIGVMATFVLGYWVPLGIVAALYGLGPGAGDAVFVWMLITVPIAGVLSLVLVCFLTALFYRKLGGDSSSGTRGT